MEMHISIDLQNTKRILLKRRNCVDGLWSRMWTAHCRYLYLELQKPSPMMSCSQPERNFLGVVHIQQLHSYSIFVKHWHTKKYKIILLLSVVAHIKNEPIKTFISFSLNMFVLDEWWCQGWRMLKICVESLPRKISLSHVSLGFSLSIPARFASLQTPSFHIFFFFF